MSIRALFWPNTGQYLRCFPLRFRQAGTLARHYALIGMTHIEDGVPLYYDAANEAGLCLAGLNFVQSAEYAAPVRGRVNLAHFELPLWLLGQFSSVRAAQRALKAVNLTQEAFSEHLPAARLHWLSADRTQAVVIEATRDGLHVLENPTGC